MAERKNKYTYEWVIQGNYGYGWEDEAVYDKREYTRSNVRRDYKEYCLACPQGSHRIIERRELNTDD